MGLQNCEFRTSENLDKNYTYMNLHSEGGLYKPYLIKKLLSSHFVIDEDMYNSLFSNMYSF